MGRKITGMRLPANVMFTNGSSSLQVGAHFATGFTMSGIVESMEQEGDVVVVTFAETKDQVVLFGSGAIAEVAPKQEKKK